MSFKRPPRKPNVFAPWLRRFTDERAEDIASTVRLYKGVQTAFTKSVWSNPHVLEGLLEELLKRIDPPPPTQLYDVFAETIRELLNKEAAIFHFPDLDPAKAMSLKEQVDLRRFLRAKQHFLDHDDRAIEILAAALVAIFSEISQNLPALTDGTTTMTVPLSVLTTNLRETVHNIVIVGFDETLADTGMCTVLANTLQQNLYRISGVDPSNEKSAKKVIVPLEYDGDPADYLAGTPFLHLFNAQVPFVIPRKTWAEHGALFGKSGHGKTQTLRAIVAGFLQEDDPPALFIIDSLGSLIEGIADLEVFSGRLKDRLVIIDAADPAHMPALNFFNLQSDDLCFYLFKAIDQGFTARQATMISYLMELMRNVKGAGLLTLINVCESKVNPYPQETQALSPFAQSFFENQFYAKKPDQLVQQTKNQIASRMYTLARMPKFEQIFSASQGQAFDPYTCMQQKKICLINTDARPPRLGGLGEQASGVFGRFILALCLDAARGRPKDQRHLALLVVDEAKAYMDDQAALILSDARQFGLGMLLASQFPHQLEEGVRREINTNTSVRMMGPVEYAVASQYARDMFTTPEMIMRMKSYDRSHTEWATYVANLTEKAVKLDVPFGIVEKMPKRAHVRLPYGTLEAMPAYRPPVNQPGNDQNSGVGSSGNASDGQTASKATRETLEGPSKPEPTYPADVSNIPTKPDIPQSTDDDDEPLIKPGKDW